MKFTIHYGCYLGMDEQEIEADSIEEAGMIAYEEAIQVTDDWLGMHGFHCDCSVDGEGYSMVQTGGECCKETVEEAAEYWAEEID